MSSSGICGACCRDNNELDITKELSKNFSGLPGMSKGEPILPEPPQRSGQTAPDKDSLFGVGAQPVLPPPPYASGVASEDKALVNGELMAANRQQGRKLTPPPPYTPTLFTVELQKTPAMGKVGLEADHSDGETLKITLVKEGMIRAHNQTADRSKQVNPGDRILEVNGFTGDSKRMLQAIGRDQSLRFMIRRHAN